MLQSVMVNSNEIKIIITDVDDTFLNENLEVGSLDKQTMARLDKAGIPLVLCSGRSTRSIIDVAHKIFPDFHNRFIVGYNGAEIFDLEKNKLIYSKYLHQDIAKKIALVAERENIFAQVYKDGTFYGPHHCKAVEIYQSHTGDPFQAVGKVHEFIDFDTPKILLHSTPEKLANIYPEIKSMTDGRAHLTYSKPIYLESFNLEVNKGEALRWITQYLGFEVNETLAMGDSPNDKEMLEAAGISVAVRNASDDIKKVAKFTLEASHNENPLTEVVKRFVLANDSMGKIF